VIAAIVVALAIAGGSTDPADPGDLPEDSGATLPAPDAHSVESRAGLDSPAAIGVLQVGTGCLVLLGAIPLAVVCTLPTLLGLPFLLGWFETAVADRVGPDRAPAMAPIITAYVGVLACTGAAAGAWLGAPALGLRDEAQWAAALGAAAVGLALTSAAVPIAYRVAAVPKSPHDDGLEGPDFWRPRTPRTR
jgi:hypothetical protein